MKDFVKNVLVFDGYMLVMESENPQICIVLLT